MADPNTVQAEIKRFGRKSNGKVGTFSCMLYFAWCLKNLVKIWYHIWRIRAFAYLQVIHAAGSYDQLKCLLSSILTTKHIFSVVLPVSAYEFALFEDMLDIKSKTFHILCPSDDQRTNKVRWFMGHFPCVQCTES